jgi:hypothetical protein
MGPLARYTVVAAVVSGALGGFLLFRTQRDPCGALLRRYVATYEGLKPCRNDAECVLDPLPPRGPGVCDRARARAAGRAGLPEVERAWEEASCPAPGVPCPPSAGAACQKGRCVTLLAR